MEPKMHSHITDALPGDHPLAFSNVRCQECAELVHAFNNECMTTWVETGMGNYCLCCFAHKTDGVVDYSFALGE